MVISSFGERRQRVGIRLYNSRVLLDYKVPITIHAVGIYSDHRGFPVIATASSRNHAAILSLGAIACEDYKDPKIVAKLKAAANGNPIKFAIDCVGTDGSSDRVVEAMSPGGHLISIMPASDTAEASAKEKDIKVEMILAGTLGGQEVRVVDQCLQSKFRLDI